MSRALTILRLAPISFVFAIGLLSALGLAGAWAVSQDVTSLGVILWMLPSVVVGALFTIYGTALLQGSLTGSTVDSERGELWRQGRIITAVFVIFSVTVSIAGMLYVKDLRTTVRQQKLDQQQAIATLKAQAVQKFLVDQTLAAAKHARSVASLIFDSQLEGDQQRPLLEVLFAEVLADSPGHVAVRLFAPDGKLLASSGEAPQPDEGKLIAADFARPGGAVARIQQRHLPLPGTPLRIDFVQPVAPAPGQPAKAALVISVDPMVSLYPDLARWPTDSPGSEVVLVRREGDHVNAVAIARGLADPKRHYSFPLTRTDIVAVQAVLHGDGVRQGHDYRGVEVLAATRRVEELDWHVVAKTDVAEVLTPTERRAWLVTWLTVLAIVLAGLTALGLWHTEKASMTALKERHERERRAITRHYEQMFRSASDIVLLVDDTRHIIEANKAAIAAYGYSLDELRKIEGVTLRAPSEQPLLDRDWNRIYVSEEAVETVHQRRDGSTFPVEIRGNFFEVDGRRYYQSHIRDISARRRLEDEVQRLGRVQSALQAATGLMLRATTEAELYDGMCRVLIDVGGYRLAHVAVPRSDPGKTVEIVASAGHADGYLDGLTLSWGDGPLSRGPTGSALRTGKVSINQDFEHNTSMAPWREAALKRGLHASIGLPLRADTVLVAALTIYSEQPFAFNDAEVGFLQQFAADFSYGLSLLRSQPS
jgi:PAS domain S-box-containing protein